MSKSIIIDEAGLPKALTVDALRTSKQGGGSEDWLPADGTNLVELGIGGSGTYRASDYNAYGISVARVTPKYGGGAISTAALQPVFSNLHTPAIREGGNPKYMGARLLKTNLQGGGTCLWVPEDEVNLESKYVNHSGTYLASADDCYGFSQITVSGVDVEITQDGDGNDVAEITDGGETREIKLPSSIVIETPPTFTGPYDDGQTITDAGMVVKAYKGDGTLWTYEKYSDGIIPLSELTLNPQTADKDSASGGYGQIVWEGLVQPAYLIKVEIGDLAEDRYSAPIVSITGGDLYYAIYGSGTYQRAYLATASGVEYSKGDANKDRYRNLPNNEFTYNGETYYYSGSTGIGPALPQNLFYRDLISAPQELGNPDFYGALLYGASHGGGSVSKKEVITVSWPRPYDNKILSATFEITF